MYLQPYTQYRIAVVTTVNQKQLYITLKKLTNNKITKLIKDNQHIISLI